MQIGYKQDNSIVVKSAAWYTISNLLVRASGFITIPIFTRVLTQAEYGQYNNFLSWTAVVGIITSMSLESTLISAKYDFKNDFKNYVFSISVVSIMLAGFWWVLACCVMPMISELLAMDPLYINSMFLYLLFQPLVNIFQTYERFQYQWKTTILTSMIVSVGAAALSVGLVFVFGDKLLAVVIGKVAPMILVGLFLLVLYLKERCAFIAESIRYALPIAAPFIPHLLSMNLLGALNKIFIEQMCGSEANALYSLANNCGLIVSIFTTSLNGAFAPWLGDKLAQGDYEATRKFSRPYIALFALLALGASLLAPEIMYVLGGEEYIVAANLIPAISMGCVFQFAYCMYVNIEQFKKKTLGMALASMSAALLNAILDVLLIPRFGYEIASLATAASYCWLLVMHMLLVMRMGLLKAYDTKFNLAIVGVVGVSMGIISSLYPFIWARLLLGCAVLLALLMLLPKLKGLKQTK